MKNQHYKKITQLVIDVMSWVCILILFIGALAAIAFQIEAIAFRYPLDYGEAPLLNQAVHMSAGNTIYQTEIEIDQSPYTIANYPPIYVGIMAIFEVLFGPAFWYGRLISSLSAIGSSALIILLVYSRSRSWRLAIIPGLLFFNIPYIVGWSTLARIDHLALFFALLGLYFLFAKQTTEKLLVPSFITGSIFLVLAIYTRQSYALAAPLAGFLYLSHRNWKQGLLLAGVVGGLSLLVFILINMLTSGGFYFNIVTANINPFGFERMINNLRNFFVSAPVIFILAAFGLVLSFKQIDGWPMLVGFVFGGFFSALTIGKVGSNVNYFLEFAAAMCLLIGFGLLVLVKRSKKDFPLILVCLSLFLLSWQGLYLIRTVQTESRAVLAERQQSYEALEKMENMVRQNIDRPILADEYMGVIVLAGQKLYLQPFEVTQLANAGIFDQDILIEEIEDEVFSLILLQEGSWWEYVLQERWTPEMLEAIRLNYRLTAQLENTNVYQPRTRQVVITPTECPKGAWPLPSNAYMGYRYQEGILVLYGAGAEGHVPVKSPADGEVYRPGTFPEGSLIIVHDDPLNSGKRVMTLFEDMRSYRGEDIFIVEAFPSDTEGVGVEKGDLIGYQAMWSGRALQQDWLHINIGIAPYDPRYLEDYDLLRDNLVNPADYFGIVIDHETTKIRPLECLQ